jgi:uncharacterized protein YlxW (UPF0749 family)
MGLLFDVMNRAVDPGYAQAAARPVVTRSPARRAGRTATHLLVAVLLGIGTITAITTLRAPAGTSTSPRALLEREIAERSAEAEELARTNEALSAEVAQIQEDALEAANPTLFARLQEAELASGAIAVTGPGLVIELSDSEDEQPDDDAARVQDIDLQIVTNALWAAGAEAIAVNGQRLTALSAIRGAGPAILVDLAPLLGPYRVEAIGDARVLQTEFARSSAANHLAFLSGTYGIGVVIAAESNLALPGAGDTALAHARAPSPDVTSSVHDQEGTP